MNKHLFETVERILKADTSDLKELAAIAGLDPRDMYAGADLSHADLRQQDVSFLLGLRTQHKDAILTTEQRKMLTDSEPSSSDLIETARQISSLRISIIKKFVSSATNILTSEFAEMKRENVSWILAEQLLEPVEKNASVNSSWQFGITYIDSALLTFSDAGFFGSRRFAHALFDMFFKVKCGATLRVAKEFDRAIPRGYTIRDRAKLLGIWKPNQEILLEWVKNSETDSEGQTRALEIAKVSSVGFELLEALMEFCEGPADYAALIANSNAHLDRNESEAIAYIMVSAARSERDVRTFLGPGMPALLKQVIIRQLLVQGNLNLIKAVVKWLEEQPGGVGGIAISDAILATGKFDPAYDIAKNIGYHLGSAQRQSMLSALEEIAMTVSERSRVSTLKKRLTH